VTTLSAATQPAIGEAGRWHGRFTPFAPTDAIDRHRIEERIARRGALRRFLDVLGAILLLIPGVPLIVLAGLAIRADDRGPWLYRQQRVGKNGQPFTLLKLRTMRVDAESDGCARWASLHDERITRVGRWLRHTRIDELPQLFNVLRGEMSLIGPRPERACFVEELARELPHYALRHLALPGITGYAQVHAGYAASHSESRSKLAYDLYYLAHQSWMLDLAIATRTVVVLVTGRGAR
jgi:lipopolysaccharide/colanic/teichoic acid biosynthesis glycosyltransferase